MSSNRHLDLPAIANRLEEFAKEREWDQFHSPKNLAMALSAEVGELVEVFQWLSEEQSANLPPDALDRAREEAADILLYLVRLSEKLSIDLTAAVDAKLAVNAKKYPVEKARGNSKKYTDLK